MTGDDVRISTTHAYDRIVDDFVRKNSGVPVDFAAFRSDFVSEVRTRGWVADLGCGPGRDASHFRAVGLEVVGVDASRQMVLRAHDVGVPVAQGDIRMIPVRPASLDGIWSAASLLHVPRAEVPRTLDAWRSCLRAAGVLGLSTSLGDDEGWEVCPYDPLTQPSGAPLRRWFVHHDRVGLLALLEATGFDVLSVRERESHRRWLQVLARRR